MNHSIHDRLLFYLLGNLSPEDAAEVGEFLAGNADARAQFEALRDAAEGLVLAAPETDPPAGLKRRLMTQIREPGFQRGETGDWVPTGVPNVDVRVLYRDDDRQTVMIRMAAGSRYPCHRHAGLEECYVVKGKLIDGDLVMHQGDYVAYPQGTQHGPLGTDVGCLLLVTSSLHDEIVDED